MIDIKESVKEIPVPFAVGTVVSIFMLCNENTKYAMIDGLIWIARYMGM